MFQDSQDSGGKWVEDKSKGPEPKNWTWKYQGPLPWRPSKGAPRGDFATLATWMKEMHEWGGQVATKCRDLEERVKFLETELERRASR